MKIIFAGTPDYAVPSLKALLALKPVHEVVGIVTQPDRPKGRSITPSPPPVKAAALEAGFPAERIFQPKSINMKETLEQLRALNPDVLCVVAYGGLLKDAALTLAKLCPINAHGSLLPKYRGASPIQAALLNGDPETGVSIMKMVRELDAGPELLRKVIPIAPDETAGTLHDKLAELSAACFVDAIARLEAGPVTFIEQDHSLATHVGKLEKDASIIQWQRPAKSLECFIRAMTPWPGAWTRLNSQDGKSSKRARIAKAAVSAQKLEPGQWVLDEKGTALLAGAGDGHALAISRIQLEGAKELSVQEVFNGAGRTLGKAGRLA